MAQTTHQPAPPLVSRKRSDTSDDAEEPTGKKRSRGRPRLETKDETAAERRRTQIRMAQRAYRNRKDSAIDTLKKKVKELEQAKKEMSREFMNFSDFVVGQGMLQGSPEVAQRLNDATRRFLALSRKASEEGTEDDDTNASELLSELPARAFPAPAQQSPKRTPSDSTPSTGDTRSTPPTEWSLEQVPSTGVQVQTTPDPFQQFDPLVHKPADPITRPSVVDSSFPVVDDQSSLSLFRDPVRTSPFGTLPVPNTYSPQERNFGRRYQRASVEAGLSLALMENPPPDRYMAVFSFCLQFESRQEIIRRLSIILDKTRNESMNNWQFPFTHLGGAGTWLACPMNRDAAGNEIPVGNYGMPQPQRPSRTGFSTGPFREDVELTRDVCVDNRMQMLHPGFEGDFFDADEVDGYLRQSGIFITEGKDYIDADVDLEALWKPPVMPQRDFGHHRQELFTQDPTVAAPAPVTAATPVAAPVASPDMLTTYSANAEAAGNAWPATTTGSMEPFALMNNPLDMPALDSTLGALNPGLPGHNDNQFSHSMPQFADMLEIPWRVWEAPPAPKKTKVTIDVNRLVTELVMRSVCLGRSPGIRPKDVNVAVNLSIVLQEA